MMPTGICAARGTPVFTQSEARRHYIGVRAGSLDDPGLGKPQMAICGPRARPLEPPSTDRHCTQEPKQPPPPKGVRRPHPKALSWARSIEKGGNPDKLCILELRHNCLGIVIFRHAAPS